MKTNTYKTKNELGFFFCPACHKRVLIPQNRKMMAGNMDDKPAELLVINCQRCANGTVVIDKR